ncbi:MAG: hypothetical protein IPL62_17850 [Caulobacteraceae bacterium]|nr:hypothetical protein [Caulobacteraceae bacterium]
MLEARLQRRGLTMLAGLNEGVWPTPPAQDPFLSRAMRDKLGLPSQDARIGLAAHRISRNSPTRRYACAHPLSPTRRLSTLASRWLWRLKHWYRREDGAGVGIYSGLRQEARRTR